MERNYEDDAFDLIKEFREEVEKSIRRLGGHEFKLILTNRFALTDKKADDLVDIFYEMIPGASSMAFLEDGFFMKRRAISKSLKNMRRTIREERQDLIDAINSFWKLPKDSQSEIIGKWPKKYHKYLLKEKIVTDDEEVVYTAPQIANLILAEKYEATPTTINSYAKARKGQMYEL